MTDVIEIIQRKAVVEIRGSGPPGPPSSPPTGTGFRHVTAGAEDPAAKLVAASDISDIELAALAGLTSAADKLPYFTGSGTAALADLTAFIRTLLDDADATAARTTLGAETAGAAAAAQAASQPLDSDLTAIAALATTSFGRSLLALADDAAGRTAFALGTAAVANTGTGASNVPTITQADARYQPLDSDLTAIAALSTTAYGRSLLEAANAAALRTLAGLVIGTDVQAQDAELAALAGLTSAADKVPYFTGSGTASVADFTAAGRALVDDADNSAQRTTLGLGTIATQNANNVNISGGAVTGITDIAVADGGTGASTAADARTNLGLVIGTNVQAQDPELSAVAGLASAADKLPYFTGSGTAALADLTTAGRALIDDADASAQRTTLGLVAIASSGSASDLSAGTVPDARMPALTGDVTTSAGAVATTIATNVVTNAKAAQMAANTVKMNNTGSTANAIDATLAEVLAWLGTNSPLGDLGTRGAPPYFI